ncbi:MAG: neutral/alkaline non-lysosomal ceramidase N-terminal domain-containing protein [Chloroflexota bacterium]
MEAGAAALVVTPPLDVQTWGDTASVAHKEIHDDLYARALVVRGDGRGSDGGHTVAIVCCDAVGFDGRAFVEDVRRLVEAQTGISGTNVMVTATHTHNAPWTIRMHDARIDPRWVHVWQRQLASAVALAHRRARPARLRAGVGTLDVAQNRRVLCADGKVYRNWQRPKPAPVVRDGPIDRDLTVLWVEGEDGAPLAALANYAMHPITAMGLPVFSADFPGVMVREVERAVAGTVLVAGSPSPEHDRFVALFTNGAAGDVNPPEVRRSFEDTEAIGRRVGGAVVEVIEGLRGRASHGTEATVAVASRPLHPTFRDTLPLAEAREAWEQARGTPGSRAALRQYQLSAVAAENDPVEIQVLRLGDLALVGVPGELFVEIGLAIKRESPAPLTQIVGYANDWQGYFPTPNAYDEGAYEVEPSASSRYTADAGRQIRKTALELLRELF